MPGPSDNASEASSVQTHQSLKPDAAETPRGVFWRAAKTVAKWSLGAIIGYFTLCSLLLVLYNWVYPPTTGVQIQRRVEALFADRQQNEYRKRYKPRSVPEISPHLLHAVVAAEDTRFFEHEGFDWEAIRQAYEEGGRRGGSTISQQLAKNLFLTTHRSYVRKAFEVPLTFLTELLLRKDRILEIYVNVVEWGDGVYGVEMAARSYFNVSAESLSRTQAAALASCLPDPRRRRPRTGSWYTNVILRRMDALGY